MEPEGSLPWSQDIVSFPHPEPDETSHAVPSYFFNINININPPFTSGPPKWSLSITFPH